MATVQKAIATGRLKHSLTTDGKGYKKILSAEAADNEWLANTRSSTSGEEGEDAAQRLVPDEQATYAEARRRREIEQLKQARLASERDELDLAERRGDLISATAARAAIIDEYTEVRTKMLGLPSRCKQRIAKLSKADVRVIDELVREALEALADGD